MDVNNKIVVLSGGVGGARFLEGLIQVVPQEGIFVIENTGDDREFYGLHVSPDIDIVIYTLAGVVNQAQGWGLLDETYTTMKQLTFLENEDWFMLGDKDLATHIHRTNLLHQGKSLSYITEDIKNKFGLKITLIPMTDQSMQTHIKTKDGIIHFEEYFVKNRCQDEIIDIIYQGVEQAKPAPGILDAISTAKSIIIAPSNPLVSIGTILSVSGIRDALIKTKAKIAAISPIISGMSIKGPADKMMKSMGIEVSAIGIANQYKDFLDIMVIDEKDIHLKNDIQQLGMTTIVTNTVMKDSESKASLARKVLASF